MSPKEGGTGQSDPSRRNASRPKPPPSPLPSDAERQRRERQIRERLANSASVESAVRRNAAANPRAKRTDGTKRPSAKIIRRRRIGVMAGLVVLVAGVAGGFGISHLSSHKKISGPGVTTSLVRRGGTGTVTTVSTSPVTTTQPVVRTVGKGVGLVNCTFIDSSRSTHNYYTHGTTPGRTLVTQIRYPTISAGNDAETPGAAVDMSGGPYPMVMFAEGYKVLPTTYKALLDYWVGAGFVVVAPEFPDTNKIAVAEQHGIDTEADDVNEPADVAFVTSQVEHDSATSSSSCPVLHDLINPSKVVLAGQSDGAQIVAALEYNDLFTGVLGTLSYRAVAVLSGDPYGQGSYVAGQSPPPVLFVQSNADHCNPPQEAVELYDEIPIQTKWFLTIYGADHLTPYEGIDRPAFDVVAPVTAQFFHLAIANTMPGQAFAGLGNSKPGVASLTSGPDAPSLPSLSQTKAACYLSAP